MVRIGGKPVAAGGSHGTHGDHYNLTGLLELQKPLADKFRSKGAATAGADAQYHGLEVFILAGLVDLGQECV